MIRSSASTDNLGQRLELQRFDNKFQLRQNKVVAAQSNLFLQQSKKQNLEQDSEYKSMDDIFTGDPKFQSYKNRSRSRTKGREPEIVKPKILRYEKVS